MARRSDTGVKAPNRIRPIKPMGAEIVIPDLFFFFFFKLGGNLSGSTAGTSANIFNTSYLTSTDSVA